MKGNKEFFSILLYLLNLWKRNLEDEIIFHERDDELLICQLTFSLME